MMRVVVDRKMVIGHVMRYPGEVVEVPDVGVGVGERGSVGVTECGGVGGPSTAAAASAQDEGESGRGGEGECGSVGEADLPVIDLPKPVRKRRGVGR